MGRSPLEVADILNRHGDAFLARHRLSRGQMKVIGAIRACRTAALGGHVARCEDCDHSRIAYNSCRNRHCPKCQGQVARAWLERQQADLLPVPYYHAVFTLPAPVAAMAFQNKAVVYDILFRTAADSCHRIRHYGLFASGTRAINIARIRSLLARPAPPREAASEPEPAAIADPPVGPACPCCGGRMIIVERFQRGEVPRLRPSAVGIDTS